MAWTEVFAVFAVCHVVGDFLFQTDWQALYKHGGLSKGGEHLRALTAHVVIYTLAFIPAFIWIGDDIGAGWAAATAAAIFIPHFLQDDGWVVSEWMRKVKHTQPESNPGLAIAVDQSMHGVMLMLTALALSAV